MAEQPFGPLCQSKFQLKSCSSNGQPIEVSIQVRYIESGQLTLGEPCAPYTLTRCTVVDGKVQQTKVEIYGRKIPLLHIRKSLLLRHERYMRLHTDEEIAAMTRDELLSKRGTITASVTPPVLSRLSLTSRCK